MTDRPDPCWSLTPRDGCRCWSCEAGRASIAAFRKYAQDVFQIPVRYGTGTPNDSTSAPVPAAHGGAGKAAAEGGMQFLGVQKDSASATWQAADGRTFRLAGPVYTRVPINRWQSTERGVTVGDVRAIHDGLYRAASVVRGGWTLAQTVTWERLDVTGEAMMAAIGAKDRADAAMLRATLAEESAGRACKDAKAALAGSRDPDMQMRIRVLTEAIDNERQVRERALAVMRAEIDGSAERLLRLRMRARKARKGGKK